MPGENELWLPELVYPETLGQIDDAYLDRLYRIFERDFVLTKPEWPGLRFALKRYPYRNGWSATFWHIISEGPDEDSRVVNVERCARISWPRVLITEFRSTYPRKESERIVWWRQRRSGTERLAIAVSDFSYLVILEERRDYVLLWTAYPTRRHTAAKLQSQFNEYWSRKG